MATDPFSFYRTGVRSVGLGLREEDENRRKTIGQQKPDALPAPPKAPRQSLESQANEKSILRKTGDAALDTVGGIGNLLDVPGSVARDVLTWLPGGPAPENPFDQLAPWNWTKSRGRITGEEFLDAYGVKPENKLLGFGAGLAFEIATDPLSYLSGGMTAAVKGGSKGAVASRALKKAGLLDNVDLYSKAGSLGKRETLLKSSAKDVLESDLIAKSGPDTVQRASNEFERAIRSDKSFKKMSEGMSPEQVSKLVSEIKAEKLSDGSLRVGAFGQGVNFGSDKIARGFDKTFSGIRYSKPIVGAAARMTKVNENLRTAESQKAMRKYLAEQQGAFVNARERMYENLRFLDPILNDFGDLSGDALNSKRNEVGFQITRFMEDIGRQRRIDVGEDGIERTATKFDASRNELFDESLEDYKENFLSDLRDKVSSTAESDKYVDQDVYNRVESVIENGVADDIKDSLDELIVQAKTFQDIEQLEDVYSTYLPRTRQTSRGILSGSSETRKAFDPENPFRLKRKSELRNLPGGTAALQRMSVDPRFAGVYSKKVKNAVKEDLNKRQALLDDFKREYASDLSVDGVYSDKVEELFDSITKRDILDVQRGVPMFGINPAESSMRALEQAYKAKAQAQMYRDVIRDEMYVQSVPGGRFASDARTTFGATDTTNAGVSMSQSLARKLSEGLGVAEEEVSKRVVIGDADGPGGRNRPSGGGGGGSATGDGGSPLLPSAAGVSVPEEDFNKGIALLSNLPAMGDEVYEYAPLVDRLSRGSDADVELAGKILEQRSDILDVGLKSDGDDLLDDGFELYTVPDEEFPDFFRTQDGSPAAKVVVDGEEYDVVMYDPKNRKATIKVADNEYEDIDLPDAGGSQTAEPSASQLGDTSEAVEEFADSIKQGLEGKSIDSIVDDLANLTEEEVTKLSDSYSMKQMKALRTAAGLDDSAKGGRSKREVLDKTIAAAREKAGKQVQEASLSTQQKLASRAVPGTKEVMATEGFEGVFYGQYADGTPFIVRLPSDSPDYQAMMTEDVLPSGGSDNFIDRIKVTVDDIANRSGGAEPVKVSQDLSVAEGVHRFKDQTSRVVAVNPEFVETLTSYYDDLNFSVSNFPKGKDRSPRLIAHRGSQLTQESYVGHVKAEEVISSVQGKKLDRNFASKDSTPFPKKDLTRSDIAEESDAVMQRHLEALEPGDREYFLRHKGSKGSDYSRVQSAANNLVAARGWQYGSEVPGGHSVLKSLRESGLVEVAYDNRGETYYALNNRKLPRWLTTDPDAFEALPNRPGLDTKGQLFGGDTKKLGQFDDLQKAINSIPSSALPHVRANQVPYGAIMRANADVRESVLAEMLKKDESMFNAFYGRMQRSSKEKSNELLKDMDRVRSQLQRSKALQNVTSNVTATAPGRDGLIQKATQLLGGEKAATAIAVSDATAMAWARSTRRNADEYYDQISDVVVIDPGSIAEGAKGSITFDPDAHTAIIKFVDGETDVDTIVHELVHYAEKKLAEIDPDLKRQANEAVGAVDDNWTVAQKEEFARGMEIYLSKGVAPTKELEGVYEKIAQWIKDLYRGLTMSEFSTKSQDKLEAVYARMQGAETTVTPGKSRPSSRKSNAMGGKAGPRASKRKIVSPEEKRKIADAIGVSLQKLTGRGNWKTAKNAGPEEDILQDKIEGALSQARDILAENQQESFIDTLRQVIVAPNAGDSFNKKLNELINKAHQAENKLGDFDAIDPDTPGYEYRMVGLDEMAQEIKSINPSAFEGEGDDALFRALLAIPSVRRGNKQYYLDRDAVPDIELSLYDDAVIAKAVETGMLDRDILPDTRSTSGDFDFPGQEELFQRPREGRGKPQTAGDLIKGQNISSVEVKADYNAGENLALVPDDVSSKLKGDELNQYALAVSKPEQYRSQFDHWVITKGEGIHSLPFKKWLGSDLSDEFGDFSSVGTLSNSEWLAANGIPSEEMVRSAVSGDKRKGMVVPDFSSFFDGMKKSLRIDIPAYETTGQYVVTLHEYTRAVDHKGAPLGYSGMGRLGGKVVFGSREGAAKKIASGVQNKSPIATVSGVLYEGADHRVVPSDLDDWTPVGYNPKKSGFFYDKRNGEEVIEGVDAMSIGNTVYVREVTKRGSRNANLDAYGEYAYKRTKSKYFKEWFGNSVLTEKVKSKTFPQALYHGTGTAFTEFRPSRSGEFGPGIYMTTSPNEASSYASVGENPQMMKVYARVENPFVVKSDPEELYDWFDDYTKDGSGREAMESPDVALKDAGYDGIVYERPVRVYDNQSRKIIETGEMQKHVVVFESNQVKSVSNRGTFSDSPNILYHSRLDPQKIDIKGPDGDPSVRVNMPQRDFAKSRRKTVIEALRKSTGEEFSEAIGNIYSGHLEDISPELEATARLLYGATDGDWDKIVERDGVTKTAREWMSGDFAKYATGKIKPPIGLGGYFDGLFAMAREVVSKNTEAGRNYRVRKFFGDIMNQPFGTDDVRLSTINEKLKSKGPVATARLDAMLTGAEATQANRNVLRERFEHRKSTADSKIQQKLERMQDPEVMQDPSKVRRLQRQVDDLEAIKQMDADQWLDEADEVRNTVSESGRTPSSHLGIRFAVSPNSRLRQVKIPNWLAQDLYKMEEGINYLEDDFNVGPFLKWFDGYSALFKSGVTSLHPGFHIRNFFSGFVQNVLNDVNDPRYSSYDPRRFTAMYSDGRQMMYRKAVEEANKIEGLQSMTDLEATEQLAKELLAYGVIEQPGSYRDMPGVSGSPLSSQLLGPQPGVNVGGKLVGKSESNNMLDFVRSRSPFGPPPVTEAAKAEKPKSRLALDSVSDSFRQVAEASRAIGDVVEFQHRVGGFIALRRQGYSASEAAKRINLLHVDYSNLSTFEKEYLRRAIPFYSFSRGMAKYLSNELMTRPAGPVGMTIRAQNKTRDRDVATPTYVSKGLSIPVGSNPDGTRHFITGLGLMHEQPVQQAAPLFGFDPAKAFFGGISNMNPLLKAPLELAFDESSFQEGVSGGVDLDDARPPVGQMITNLMDREDDQPVRLGKAFEVFAGSSPLSRYIKTISQMADDRKGFGGRFVAPLTGFRVTSVSPERQDAVLRERAEEYLQGIGGRQFVKRYIPDDVYERMSEDDKAIADNYMALIEELGKRGKERRANKKLLEQETEKGLVDG